MFHGEPRIFCIIFKFPELISELQKLVVNYSVNQVLANWSTCKISNLFLMCNMDDWKNLLQKFQVVILTTFSQQWFELALISLVLFYYFFLKSHIRLQVFVIQMLQPMFHSEFKNNTGIILCSIISLSLGDQGLSFCNSSQFLLHFWEKHKITRS